MFDTPRGMPLHMRTLVGALYTLVAMGNAACRSKATSGVTAAPDTAPLQLPLVPGLVIYDAGLKPGWEDRSSSSRRFSDGAPASVDFGSFGGVSLRHERLGASFGALAFRYKAPPGFADFLSVSLRLEREDNAAFPTVTVDGENSARQADGFTQVVVPMSRLDPKGLPFDGIVIQARRMVPDDLVLVDNLMLTRGGATAGAGPGRYGVVTLDCRGESKVISPLIYGAAQVVRSSGATAHRVGGNAMTRLNWDLGNAWNTGNDWFFENVRSEDGKGLTDWLAAAQETGLQMAITVPMIGWVAKDTSSSSFPRSKFPVQRKFDQFRKEAGDGFSNDGKPLTPLAPTQTSDAAPPERIRHWVETIAQRDKQSGKRSVAMYMLDNEPDLWHVTHRDVHPEPLTYDELLDRTLRYGSAIRKADPQALIAGPTSWGWTGYFFSPKDTIAGALLQPDRRAHDGEPLLAWYLRKLREHEQNTGERILDVLDVHYYPQAEKVYSDAADAETAARRLRSTRSLWDPSYADESWIKDNVRLLPRLKEWVDANYPGLKISLGEWSFGGEKDVSGALATAEALGRFGLNGLFSAFYWTKPTEGSSTYYGFRAFRNYDGKGAHFLDHTVKAGAPKQISAFASRDESQKHFVVVLLNFDDKEAANVDFDASSCGGLTQGRSFNFRSAQGGISADPDAAGSSKGVVLPPYSISIVEFSAR